METQAKDAAASTVAEMMAAEGPLRAELQQLPVREYLDQAVVPVLLRGLQTLARDRPPNPVEHLAVFLLANNPQQQQK